jgi:hypothetical protein
MFLPFFWAMPDSIKAEPAPGSPFFGLGRRRNWGEEEVDAARTVARLWLSALQLPEATGQRSGGVPP